MHSTTTIERPVVDRAVLPPPSVCSFDPGRLARGRTDRPGDPRSSARLLNQGVVVPQYPPRYGDGRALAIFASFFRYVVGRDEQTGEPIHAHSIAWALSDLQAAATGSPRCSTAAPPRSRCGSVDNTDSANDPSSGGRCVPSPEAQCLCPTAATSEVQVATIRLALDFEGNRLTRRDDGSYRLELVSPEHHGLDLASRRRSRLCATATDGVVRGKTSEDMFYYFVPRCARRRAAVTLDGARSPSARQGWYDHEFGGAAQQRQSASATHPGRGGLELDFGSARRRQRDQRLRGDRCRRAATSATSAAAGQSSATASAGQCARGFVLAPLDNLAQHAHLPRVSGTLARSRSRAPQIELRGEAAVRRPGVHHDHLASRRSGRGACSCSGTIDGQAGGTGRGFVERSGFTRPRRSARPSSSAVGKQSAQSVRELLPLEPDLRAGRARCYRQPRAATTTSQGVDLATRERRI